MFAFSEASAAVGSGLLGEMGCSMAKPIVGIAPNTRVYERTPGVGSANVYLQALVSLVRHLVDDKGVDVVLQANELGRDSAGSDDRRICNLIAEAAACSDGVFVTRGYLNAESSKALVGMFDLLVASRFHSLVFALSQGVPAVATAGRTSIWSL